MAKVEKLLKRFRLVFEDQNFYEAHQVARTIYYRWLELNEHEKLSDFLAEKVLEFVKVNEPTIAFDLTDLYAKTLIQSNAPVDDSRLKQIEKLINAISTLENPATDQKQSSNPVIPIVNQLISWSTESPSASFTERQYGNACLNLIFAKAFEAENQLDLAKKHYTCSKDPQGYSKLILQHFERLALHRDDKEVSELPQLEDDTFLALVVLQVLAIGRLGVATKMLHLLTEKHAKYSSRPPYTSALLNFTWLLTFCVQLKSLEYFTELVETYKPSLTRDPRLIYHVDKIGQKFFGVPEKEHGFGGGLLGNLLKGMSSKKEAKPENPLDFEPDDLEFLKEYRITDQGFHAAWEAASARNPDNSCAEPHYSDALEEPQTSSAPKSNAQADMDLD